MSRLTVRIQYRPGQSGPEEARHDAFGFDAICRLAVPAGTRGAEGIAALAFQMMKEARRLVDFLEEHAPHARTIVVQCQAGISRSPTVAAAIALLYPCNTTCQAILKRYPAFNVVLFQSIVDEWARRRLPISSLANNG